MGRHLSHPLPIRYPICCQSAAHPLSHPLPIRCPSVIPSAAHPLPIRCQSAIPSVIPSVANPLSHQLSHPLPIRYPISYPIRCQSAANPLSHQLSHPLPIRYPISYPIRCQSVIPSVIPSAANPLPISYPIRYKISVAKSVAKMSEISIRPAQITKVLPDSIAAEIGFEPGDRLISINGTRPRDLIDYQFLCADEFLELEVQDTKGKTHHIEIEKDYDEDLGLEFETALFDGLIQCNNRCPFCFIDQKPPGMRDTLYLKDDDYRLSFLYGSYLTLTNLPKKEWERIEHMRLSPLYVSVHATEPEIRIRLLKNPRAGDILKQLKWFQERRLQIHAQVVVCPGINDGQHLEQTLLDLAKFGRGEVPAVASVAVVPVGLTKFRPDEDELVPVSPEKAREVIQQVQDLQVSFRKKLKSTFAWLADEWFLIAGEELPPESDYQDYPQIDNGVGSIRLFIRQFEELAAGILPKEVTPERRLTWVVGNAVEKAFDPICQSLNQVQGLKIQVMALNSEFWGQSISVTGVLTGQDLLMGLQGKDLGEAILLPTVMLKHGESRFLDDVTVEDLSRQLQVPVLMVHSVEELLNTAIAEPFWRSIDKM